MASASYAVFRLHRDGVRRDKPLGKKKKHPAVTIATATRADRSDVIISGEINIIRRRSRELFNGHKYSVLKKHDRDFSYTRSLVFSGLRA